MGWLEWAPQFDWLISALVAAALGFVFGFFARRLNAWRESARRSDEFIESLSPEVQVNRQEPESAVARG
jgi:hypothetical protein